MKHRRALTDETAMKGHIFHDDPDNLVVMALGRHDYDSIDDAKSGYAEGEVSMVEFEAILDSFLLE